MRENYLWLWLGRISGETIGLRICIGLGKTNRNAMRQRHVIVISNKNLLSSRSGQVVYKVIWMRICMYSEHILYYNESSPATVSMLPDSWHSDLQERQLAKPSAPGTCPVFRRKSCARMGNVSLMSHLVGHIKSLTSPRFISLPSRIMQMTHSTWQQPPCLELTTSRWVCAEIVLLGIGEKLSCEGKVRKKTTQR